MRETVHVKELLDYLEPLAEKAEEDYFGNQSKKSLTEMRVYRSIIQKVKELSGAKSKGFYGFI